MTELPALLLRDARACLRFERSHASSFTQAARRWRDGQQQRLQRVQRLSARDSLRLLQAEHACLEAGLSFGGSGPGRCAPWHLDETLLQAPLAQLPPHPLIDPHSLAERLGQAAQGVPALQALTRLLVEPALPAARDMRDVNALGKLPHHGKAARIAVCLHLFYPETWPDFKAAFGAIPEPFDLYLTVPHFAATPVLGEIARSYPQARVLATPNRGRDVLPFLRLLAAGHLDAYDFVCKLHSKKSPHMASGGTWRQRLLEGLLGPRERVTGLLEQLRAAPEIGLWAPADQWIAADDSKWLGTNAASLQHLQRLTGLPATTARPAYVAGTMFWVRPATLAQLRRLGTAPEAFEPEFGQTDGTLAHAVERGIAMAVQGSGHQAAQFEAAAPSCMHWLGDRPSDDSARPHSAADSPRWR